MGYSHYWDNHTFDIDDAVIADVEKIIASSPVAVVNAFGEDGTDPVLKPGVIRLNGARPHGGETLNLEGRTAEGQEPEFDFCKTCNPAYDALVVAILLRVAETNPDMTLRSDGAFDPDWTAGRELFEKTLGRPVQCPASVNRWTRKLYGSDVSSCLEGRLTAKSDGKYGVCVWNATLRLGKPQRLEFETESEARAWLDDHDIVEQ